MKDISHFWFKQRLENRKEHAESTYASSGLISTSRLSPMVLYMPGFRGTSRWPHTHRPVLLLFVSYSTPTWEIKSVKMIKIALKTKQDLKAWSYRLRLCSAETLLYATFSHMGFPRARAPHWMSESAGKVYSLPSMDSIGCFHDLYQSTVHHWTRLSSIESTPFFGKFTGLTQSSGFSFNQSFGFRHTSRFTRAELLCHSFQCSRIAFHKGELRIASGNDETTWNDLKRLPQPETSWNRVETCKLYPPEHGKSHVQN